MTTAYSERAGVFGYRKGFESDYERRVRQFQNAAALSDLNEPEIADRLIKCALENERVENSEGTQHYPLHRCGSRFCVFCYWRETKDIRIKYTERLSKLAGEGFLLVSLTLTVPNMPLIDSKVYDALFSNFRELLYREPFNTQIIGCLAKLETDFNLDYQEYHPHIHAILVCRSFIPHGDYKSCWGFLTINSACYEVSDLPDSHSSSRSVWVRRINFNENDPADIKRVVRKAVNYLCKFTPIDDPDAFARYYRAAKGKPLIRAYRAVRKRQYQAFNHL